jgi:hypothetical protein
MASDAAAPQQDPGRAWFIVGRRQEFEGEGRANLLREVGVAAFYAVEAVNYYGLDLGFLNMPQLAPPFHQAVTALAAAWVMVGLGVAWCLQARVFPAALKFISTSFDIVFLTAVLVLGKGPNSALVIGYFVILALATLRFSLPLLWFTTAASSVGYLVLLGYARWFAGRPEMLAPRYQQVLFLVGLALTGVVLGQVVRRVRTVAGDFARQIGAGK